MDATIRTGLPESSRHPPHPLPIYKGSCSNSSPLNPHARNEKETSPLAIASLAFSGLGALTFGVLCIPGIVCGCIAKGQVRRGEYSGHSLAQAGVIVGTTVLVLWLAIPLLLFGGIVMLYLGQQSPWMAGAAFSILLVLALLPFAFTSMTKRRDSGALNRLVSENRNRP